MKTLFFFILLLLPWLSLSGVPAEQKRPLDLQELDETAEKVEPLLDYRSLVDEMVRIRQQRNKFRADLEIKSLSEELKGKKFLLKDTLLVKRNALVSRELVLWFKPADGIETMLNMDSSHKKDYNLMQEYDFITVTARLLGIDEYIRLQFLELKKIEPFDERANFLNFNATFEELRAEKKKREFLSFKAYLKTVERKTKDRIGYLSGTVESMKADGAGHVMYLKTGDQVMRIACLEAYISTLADVDIGSKIDMSVYLESISSEGEPEFVRGVLIRLGK